MVCADHEWTPQDHALYEEQQRQKKHGLEKGKRKVNTFLGWRGAGRARGVMSSPFDLIAGWMKGGDI